MERLVQHLKMSVLLTSSSTSTGKRDMIQGSESTATLLIQQGKSHWVTPREDMVHAKGKGVLKTYWIQPLSKGSVSSFDESRVSEADDSDQAQQLRSTDRNERLIDWIVELMKHYLKRVIARRKVAGQNLASPVPFTNQSLAKRGSALEELRETIYLPEFDPVVVIQQEEIAAEIELDDSICSQLREYVARIAALYKRNAFHNFEHACHVTLSVHKFLQRIAKPNLDDTLGTATAASQIHQYTHGLTSDPLTLFGMVFSALIHGEFFSYQLPTNDLMYPLQTSTIAECQMSSLPKKILRWPRFLKTKVLPSSIR